MIDEVVYLGNARCLDIIDHDFCGGVFAGDGKHGYLPKKKYVQTKLPNGPYDDIFPPITPYDASHNMGLWVGKYHPRVHDTLIAVRMSLVAALVFSSRTSYDDFLVVDSGGLEIRQLSSIRC